MSLRTIIQAFRKDAEYLPLELPKLPRHPKGELTDADRESFKTRFDAFEKEFYKVLNQNNDRFAVAQVRISLCTFLHGMSDPFAMDRHILNRHFKWCPDKVWREYSSNIVIQMKTDG